MLLMTFSEFQSQPIGLILVLLIPLLLPLRGVFGWIGEIEVACLGVKGTVLRSISGGFLRLILSGLAWIGLR